MRYRRHAVGALVLLTVSTGSDKNGAFRGCPTDLFPEVIGHNQRGALVTVKIARSTTSRSAHGPSDTCSTGAVGFHGVLPPLTGAWVTGTC